MNGDSRIWSTPMYGIVEYDLYLCSVLEEYDLYQYMVLVEYDLYLCMI